MGRESSYHNGMRQDFASGCLISDPTYPSLEKSYRSILASWRAQKRPLAKLPRAFLSNRIWSGLYASAGRLSVTGRIAR